MFGPVATLASIVAGMLAASSSPAASRLMPLTRINNLTVPAGAAAPVLAWYPVGSMLRHEFMYR